MIRVAFRILHILHETFPCTLVVLCQLRYIVSHLLCTDDRILVSYNIMAFQRYKIGAKKFSTGGFFNAEFIVQKNLLFQSWKLYKIYKKNSYLAYFSITACSPMSCISPRSSSSRAKLWAISSFVIFPVAVLFFSTNFSLYAKLERLMLSCMFRPT